MEFQSLIPTDIHYLKRPTVHKINNMKTKLLFTLLLLGLATFLNAQRENSVSARLERMNNDTVRYIKEQIIAQKNLYIGKPLDSLLKDLPMQPKRYINTPVKPGIYPSTYLFLYMRENERIAQKKNPLNLVIKWETPLTKNELTNATLKTVSDKWSEVVYNFFRNRIISDLSIVKYDF